MADVDFEQYSENSVHFFSRRVPRLLTNSLKLIGSGGTLVDVGCGDGHIVWALSDTGHIPPGSRVIGVDVSEIRLRRFNALTGFETMRASGGHIPDLKDGAADLAMSTMVIEHVPDDQGHLNELARITRSGGWLYLSTVVRKRGAWYFRKAPDGRRVLDPTHLREYANANQVIKMVEAAGFVIREQRLSRLVFPVAHPLVRWLHAQRPIRDVQRIFLKASTHWLETLALPIPRYRSIEILAKRVPSTPHAPANPQEKGYGNV